MPKVVGATKKQALSVVEGVAEHVAARWEKGARSSDAYLVRGTERVAVSVAAMPQQIPRAGAAAKPRLRFDRVARGLIARLQSALQADVPAGRTLMVTVTAPIRLAAKTAAAMEARIREWLARGAARGEIDGTIHGNRIRVRLLRDGTRKAAKLIGFVHNPDTDPAVLVDAAQSLLDAMAAAGKRAVTRSRGERWLVLSNERGQLPLDVYRHIHAQLALSSGFTKILMARAGGRIEILADRESERRSPAR